MVFPYLYYLVCVRLYLRVIATQRINTCKKCVDFAYPRGLDGVSDEGQGMEGRAAQMCSAQHMSSARGTTITAAVVEASSGLRAALSAA